MFAEFQHTAIRARMHAVSTSEYIELQINVLIIEWFQCVIYSAQV